MIDPHIYNQSPESEVIPYNDSERVSGDDRGAAKFTINTELSRALAEFRGDFITRASSFTACQTPLERLNFIELRNSLNPDKRIMLTPYTLNDYDALYTRLYLSQNHDAGFGISRDGELLSVFSLIRGNSKAIIEAAIELGAIEVSCFDIEGKLPSLYRAYGFKDDQRVPWDPARAPDGWDYDRYGTPDILFLRRPSPP